MTRYLPRIVFVPLWSTGYIAGTIGTRHAPALPLTTFRFLIAALVLAALAKAARVPFPRDRRTLGHLVVAGVLLQGLQFGADYLGFAAGIHAALASLISSLAPLVVGVAAIPLFGERLSGRAWIGLALGLGGVLVAVADGLSGSGGGAAGILWTALSLVGLTGGTLYQRRFAPGTDLRAGGAISLAAGALLVAPIAAFHDGLSIPTTTGALGALAWLALVNSVGAMSLLIWLMRNGGAAATTSMLYLVPPVTALMAAVVLHQHLDAPVLAALAIAAAGVALTTTASRPAAATKAIKNAAPTPLRGTRPSGSSAR
jgi:drug/metabolite transporter (DMT)-like permease